MKALLRDKYGDPDVLRIGTVEQPKPKDEEVLVRVYATTINRTDVGHLTGKPYAIRFFSGLFTPTNKIPGTDFAGQVEAIGKNVTEFKVGDRVWGLNDDGLKSHAQYMCIGEKKAITHIPESFSYKEAVACAEGAHYALNFLNKVKLKAGDKVMVNGGTGAIGSATIQLLKARGLYVTAVCATPHLAAVSALGADRVIDYLKEDFTNDHETYVCVCDAVGKSSFGDAKKLMTPNGVYVSSELGPGAENLYLPLITKFTSGPRVIFPIPTDCRKSVLYLAELMATGKFKPLLDRSYSMEDVGEAYEYVRSGQKIGNVLLEVE